MPTPSEGEITQLLQAWSADDAQALERLTPLVYNELHRRAERYLARERPGHTLQTTALIDEVYVRLVVCGRVTWQDRNHFFAVCARLTRRILTDFACSRSDLKRGGDFRPIRFDENLYLSTQPAAELVALDDALTALAEVDKRKSDVVELRFFGGLGIKEAAAVLAVSDETIKRDWRLAKLWLLRERRAENRDGG
jgi:RNA polymerase sigma factor (TIGR02999 family)